MATFISEIDNSSNSYKFTPSNKTQKSKPKFDWAAEYQDVLDLDAETYKKV